MTVPEKKKPGTNLEWVFSFFIIFGGFYLMTKPATNTKVLIFRITVITIGVIGLITTILVKRIRAARQ